MAEHAQMRVYLTSIARRTAAPDWFRGAEVHQVKILADELQRFDKKHAPKGIALLNALRSRGTSMQIFLAELEREGDECSRRLAEAIERLDALDGSSAADAASCASAFRRHADVLELHLDREDTELRTRALRELGPDEWSHIVSSISDSLGKP